VIWLLGCNGMLGKELAARLAMARLEWGGTDREVDIRSIDALRKHAAGKTLEWIVNCAAYTAVDMAEDEPALARALNADGAGNIARVAEETGARMLHISTDYVFDGRGSRPYWESDPVSPMGVYGRSKAEGEVLVRAACASSYILRTAWLYGAHGNNFVHTMLALMAERGRVTVVADQRGSPTYAGDLAEAIFTIIQFGKSEYGIYHYTNEGETSWYDFAVAIRDEARQSGILERECDIAPITTDQYPTRAPRPAYSVLSKEKTRRVFGLEIPEWRASLRRYLQTL
jgi:dTDP-4-dehydrorhamnose reductase